GAAFRHRTLGRSAAQRPLRSVRALVHLACRREAEKTTQCGNHARRAVRRNTMNAHPSRFPAISRWLHWLMAVMVLVMLFLGIGMAASVSERYRVLVATHRA